jgi:hypothetical protein
MTATMSLSWTIAPREGRTLFFLFAYHGRDRDGDPRGRLAAWLERPGARGHLIVHRDHYANPRTLAYQLAMIAAAARQLSANGPPDLVVDRAFGPQIARELAGGFGRLERADLTNPRTWGHNLAAEAAGYQNVVLVFPDALGLGCEAAERRLLRDRDSVLVINGRRRVFEVTTAFGRRLDVSRWLARTRIFERALAMGVRPVAATLALWDRLRGTAA